MRLTLLLRSFRVLVRVGYDEVILDGDLDFFLQRVMVITVTTYRKRD